MKSYKKFITRGLLSGLIVAAAVLGVVGLKSRANAAVQAPGTPAFNIYDDVPYVGDESDFVRLRKSNGNPSSSAIDNLFIDPVNATCNPGDMFDVRTYVHNGAHEDSNQNGSGPGVAHDVVVNMTAPVGTTGKKFVFGGSINSSNATDISDNGTLNCGNDVKLELVPSKVFVYSKTLGWLQAPDSAVNGSLKIGSRVFGSGDVWGCWDDRVVVVYVVKVVKKPQPPAPVYKCDMLTVAKVSDNKYRFTVAYTAQNGATFKDVTFDFGDGQTQTTANTTVEHTYAEAKTYNTKATVNFTVNGETKSHTSADCAKQVTVTEKPCPLPGKGHLPEDSPECKETPVTPPQVLPSTGPGAGVIAAVLAAVAGGYTVAVRKFARQ